MASSTLIGLLQRYGDQTVERHKITINRNESAGFILSRARPAGRIEAARGPFLYDVLDSDKTKVFIHGYPVVNAFDLDDSLVTGLSDAEAGGTYTGTELAVYSVRISSSAASPDEFKVTKNGGTEGAAVAITAGVAQTIGDGVQITFVAGDGHTLNDKFVITANPATATFVATLECYGG